jgi:hypothetical protein
MHGKVRTAECRVGGNVLQGRSLAGTLSLGHARAWGMHGP